jgi:hypothetical protein
LAANQQAHHPDQGHDKPFHISTSFMQDLRAEPAGALSLDFNRGKKGSFDKD